MRTTNRERLRELIKAQGERGKAKVSLGAQVGLSTLEKLMAGTYGRVPKEDMRERLADYFGVDQNELFPLVGPKGKKRSA